MNEFNRNGFLISSVNHMLYQMALSSRVWQAVEYKFLKWSLDCSGTQIMVLENQWSPTNNKTVLVQQYTVLLEE